MSTWRVLYWLLVGALLGFGYIGMLSIGLPFLVLGVVLLGLGIARFGLGQAWAALVGFGALPALILLWDVTSAPWACDVPGGSALPNVNYFSCLDTPLGMLTSYHVMAAGFGAVALLGLLIPLLGMLRSTRRGAAASA